MLALDIGILTTSKYNDGGALTGQVLLHGPGASCTPGLAYSPFGFKGRPRSPGTADRDAQGNIQNGALALYWYEGNTLHTLPLDDGRRSCSPNFPQLDEGGSVFYADVDDAVTIYDGQGNLIAQVPAKQKLTIQAKNGPGIVIDGAAGTVKVGGASVALARGDALNTVIQAIISAVPSTTETGLKALGLALAQAFTTLQQPYQTTVLEGT